MPQFMFAAGIENSCPRIKWRGKAHRQDELAKTRHYQRWRDDFALLKERVEVIADLCHFGVPDWIGDFQGDED